MNRFLSSAARCSAVILLLSVGTQGAVRGQTTFTVTNVGDVDDGVCNADCSLREAINAANASAGADVIAFNIPGGPTTRIISPTAALPPITEAVTIDGTSDPDGDAIVLSGLSAPTNSNGLHVTGGSSTIRGLSIHSFGTGVGIHLDSDGNTVVDSRIGTDPSGSTALGNFYGVRVGSGAGNAIGATGLGDLNVISGNLRAGVWVTGTSSGTVIQNNWIGLDGTGTVALGNGQDGILVEGAVDTEIGGTLPGQRNVISGNVEEGVHITGVGATGNRVVGNYIGTDATASPSVRRGNGRSGVRVSGNAGPLNTVGGSGPGEGNIIGASTDHAVHVDGGAAGTLIRGNSIGTVDGATPLGNAKHGVMIAASGNTVGGPDAGDANTIAFQGRDGVAVVSGAGNRILGNSIYDNRATGGTGIYLGIDLGTDDVTANDLGDPDNGPNGLQNFPVVASAIDAGTIDGSLNSVGSTLFRLEFFSNPPSLAEPCDPTGFGEGRSFLGFTDVTTDGSGNASFSVDFGALALGDFITATATNEVTGNTSEFSACVPVQPPAADVEVANSGPAAVLPGATFVYTITVTNRGPLPATDVVIRDVLAPSVGFVSASAGGTRSGDEVTWPAIPMARGESAVRTVTVTAPTSGAVTNVASATATSPDFNPSNNDGTSVGAQVQTVVGDFSVAVSPTSASTVRGDDATYVVTVSPSAAGFGAQVGLSCAGLPAGTACAFSPAGVTPGTSEATSSLTVSTTAPNTPRGGASFSVVATSGGLSRDATVDIEVVSDFVLAVTPSSADVSVGGPPASFTVTVDESGFFDEEIAFTCSDVPAGACAFTPSATTPNGSDVTVDLTVSVEASAAGVAASGRDRLLPWWAGVGLLLLGLHLCGVWFLRRQDTAVSPWRRRLGSLVAATILASLVVLGACGRDLTGLEVTKTFTITGTSSSVTQSTTATIVVNP